MELQLGEPLSYMETEMQTQLWGQSSPVTLEEKGDRKRDGFLRN